MQFTTVQSSPRMKIILTLCCWILLFVEVTSNSGGAVLHPRKRTSSGVRGSGKGSGSRRRETKQSENYPTEELVFDTVTLMQAMDEEITLSSTAHTDPHYHPMYSSGGVNYYDDGTVIPPCISDPSELVYVKGMLSSTQTMANCMNNIADPGMLPTYSNGSYHGLTHINTTMVMNNLEVIDEIQGTAQLQFTLRLFWRDDRYSMPLFWDRVDRSAWGIGIDITQTVMENNDVTFWLPIMRFPDAAEVNVMYQCMKVSE